ncbi:retrotransposon protein, putative, ty1-copia subclass [Tanacetum coccineum]|uniref:Retrotransposon protein, putative, ty1-copia subclass n=1 Tax=Tanacetum coccineum TaxID=301880 RepID=A0ABQ5ICH2_9ASTR
MHAIRKTVNEFHSMLKLHEQSLPKKDATPTVMAIKAGWIQKNNNNKKPHAAQGKGYWRRNFPIYLAELMKKKKKQASSASTSGIFTIELYYFPNKSKVYDTGCGTHIYNTTQGLRGSKKMKPGALNLYKGNDHHAVAEAIRSFDLCLHNELIIVLDICHYAPSIIRSTRTRHAPDRMCLYVDTEEHEFWQMDVKTSFLNGQLIEEVYMVQHEGFVNPKYPNRIGKLQMSIYRLKKASRIWNKRFDKEIKKFGFTQNRDEPCVYVKDGGSMVTFLILYFNDILIMGNHILMLQDVKSYLGKCFDMNDLGEASCILGIKIYRDRSRWSIGFCQRAYIENILKKFNMENSKLGSIPIQEKLILSKAQSASTHAKVKRIEGIPYASVVRIYYNILKYLRNTKYMFLVYGGDMKLEPRVTCYTDVRYKTDADDSNSQIGYVFVLNVGVVDWKSASQITIGTSFPEDEYMDALEASKELVWKRKFIFRLGVVPTNEDPIAMYYDSTRSITIANEPGITTGAKHYRTKVHYLREVIKLGDIRLVKVHPDDNVADPCTKALPFIKYSSHTKSIGLLLASNLM